MHVIHARYTCIRAEQHAEISVRESDLTITASVMPAGIPRGNPYGSRIFNDDDKGRQPFQTRSCKRLFSFHARHDRVTLRALLLFRQWLLFATELIRRSNSWLVRCNGTRSCVSIDLREKLATWD